MGPMANFQIVLLDELIPENARFTPKNPKFDIFSLLFEGQFYGETFLSHVTSGQMD